MSERKTQVLNLSPPTDLFFKGPFSEVVTSTLTLQNPTNDPVIFKVKTTAPKHYCVRPNSGLLIGLESIVINVMLQPMEGGVANRTKHKFMVQTMMAPPDFQLENLDAVWSKTSKGSLMDSKLQCVFVEDAPSTTASAESANSGSGPQRSSSVEKPMHTDETPSPLAPSDSKQQNQEGHVVQEVVAANSAAPSNSAGSSSSLPSAGTDSAPKLRQLQNKVDELTNSNKHLQSENTKMRQRLTPGASSTAEGSRSPMKAGNSSVGPKRHLSLVAIMLILVAIVLGYLVGKWL